MTPTLRLPRIWRGFSPAFTLTLLCTSVSLVPGRLAAQGNEDRPQRHPPFSAITVIGDSLSDTGRTFSVIGVPPPPYYDGRASNGPLWIEYLSPQLRLPYDPLDNFSWAGANTGRTNVFPGLPGMLDELDEFLAPLKHRADKKALYVVFGGSNDFFRILLGADPTVVIPQAVANLRSIVETLHQNGAQAIVVVDVPDISLTPRVRAGGAAAIAAARSLSILFNALLHTALETLDFPVVRVSAFQLLNVLAANPGAFGFTNVTDPGILDLANADTYLFFDDVHVTTRVHRQLAAAVFNALESAGLIKQLVKHPD